MASSSSGCKCIDASASLLANCVTVLGEQGILYKGDVCYPLEYGSRSCKAHDLPLDPRCILEETSNGTSRSTNIPLYCQESWCFVDFDSCRMSSELVYRSEWNDALYYSYSLCNSTATNWLEYQTTENVAGVMLSVTIPIIADKSHYKHSKDGVAGALAKNKGPEYYDDNVPWQGWIIDYFDAVVRTSNLAGVKYTYRTLGADALFPDDPFTGVVHDVSAGLTDLALSTYWITSNRLAMTPYTTQVAVDQIVLWVKQPKINDGSVGDNVKKILRPFEFNLWISLFATIVIVASVNLWLATTRGSGSRMFPKMKGKEWRKASLGQKRRMVFQTWVDSVIIFSNFMFGHSVELDREGTSAQKVLMFGFGFLILIAVASYTANLAAFLTVSGVGNYVSNMEDAIYTNTPICINPVLRNELESVWEDATFIVNEEMPNIYGMLQDYENGRCQAFATSWLEIRSSSDYMSKFCQLEIVSTGSLVLENPIAFPVNEKFASGLSYWLFQAEKKDGIEFMKFAEEGFPPLQCNLKLSKSEVTEDTLLSLSSENFILPFMICGICVLLAMAMHVLRKPKDAARREDESSYYNNNDPSCSAMTFEPRQQLRKHVIENHSTNLGEGQDVLSSNDLEAKRNLEQQQQQQQQLFLEQARNIEEGNSHPRTFSSNRTTTNSVRFDDEMNNNLQGGNDTGMIHETMKNLLANQGALLNLLKEMKEEKNSTKDE